MVEEGTEGPVDGGAGVVEPGELEGAADHGEDQRADVEGGGEMAALLEPQRFPRESIDWNGEHGVTIESQSL